MHICTPVLRRLSPAVSAHTHVRTHGICQVREIYSVAGGFTLGVEIFFKIESDVILDNFKQIMT